MRHSRYYISIPGYFLHEQKQPRWRSRILFESHPFHLVESSPWPFLVSITALFFTSNFTLYMHYYIGYLGLTYISLLLVLFIIYNWFGDIVKESTFEGYHTFKVQQSLNCGMTLFIISEVMFFFSFFWAFFYSSIAPSIEIAWWPPKGIPLLSPYSVPLLNTIVLLSSGISVTLAHRAIRGGIRRLFNVGLFVTVFFGAFFTGLQAIEYLVAEFLINTSIYGSLFYLCTGFHGFHVIVGSIFLVICFFRQLFYHFAKDHHFGFESAAWYWHFVDIVWLFLYMLVYWYTFRSSVLGLNEKLLSGSRDNLILWLWAPETLLISCILFTFIVILCKYEKYTKSGKLFSKTVELSKGYLLLTMIVLAVTGFFLLFTTEYFYYITLGNCFINDVATSFFKLFLLGGVLFAFCILSKWVGIKNNISNDWEIPLLMLIGAGFMMFMMSSINLLCTFLCMEGLSLCLYFILGMGETKNTKINTLIYFVLSSVASILFIYGAARIFFTVGSFSYDKIHFYFAEQASMYTTVEQAVSLQISIAFLFFGLLFKLAAFPSYFWVRELYCSTITPVVIYFAIPVKLAAFITLFRLFGYSFTNISFLWENLFLFAGIGSIIIGGLITLDAKSTHGFVAGSGINHAGLVLCSLSSNTPFGNTAAVAHLLLYCITIGALLNFFCELGGKEGGKSSRKYLANINELFSLKVDNTKSIALIIITFSLAGIPILAGFFSKYWILLSLYKEGNIGCLFIIIMVSMLSAYYYMRLLFSGFSKENSLVIKWHKKPQKPYISKEPLKETTFFNFPFLDKADSFLVNIGAVILLSIFLLYRLLCDVKYHIDFIFKFIKLRHIKENLTSIYKAYLATPSRFSGYLIVSFFLVTFSLFFSGTFWFYCWNLQYGIVNSYDHADMLFYSKILSDNGPFYLGPDLGEGLIY
jgi:proton-translocating NADH-quinone oxidoreductase chain N